MHKMRRVLSRYFVVLTIIFASVSSLFLGEAFAAADHYAWYSGTGYSPPTIGSTTNGTNIGWLQSLDSSGNPVGTLGNDVWQSYCQNTSTGAWESDSSGTGGFGQFGTPGNYTQKVVQDCPNGSPWIFKGVCVTNQATQCFSSDSNPIGTRTSTPATFAYPSNFATNPSGAVWCSNSDFSEFAASYVGSTLSLRFKFSNANLPNSGVFNVFAPDPGSSAGTPTTTFSTSSTIDGYPKYYYAQVSVSTLTNLTVRVAAPDNTSGANQGGGCYVSGTVATNQINSTPTSSDTGNDTQTSTNGNCSFSLNPFHYLKCLFEPSSSLQQWNDLESTASTHPPISIIVGGIPYVTGAFNYGNTNASTPCSVVGHTCAPNFDDPSVTGGLGSGGTAHQLDIMTPAGNWMQSNTWGQALYGLLTASVWITGLLMLWSRISSSFGGRET